MVLALVTVPKLSQAGNTGRLARCRMDTPQVQEAVLAPATHIPERMSHPLSIAAAKVGWM
jgi:hypothetical protein